MGIDTPRGLATRAGLGIASLILSAFLVMGFRAPDEATNLGSASTGTSSGPGSAAGSSSTGSTAPVASGSRTGSTPSSTSARSTGTTTVTGSLISTRYGPVQVEVTVSNGKVTSITAVELPSGGRSGMISAYAEPILTDEALAAQSAQIDLVSGATYTSTAYEKSLQAALDRAGA